MILKVINGFILVAIVSVLLIIYFHAERNLKDAAHNLRELGNDTIIRTVIIDDTIPVLTEINVGNEVPILLRMRVNDSMNLKMAVRYDTTLTIPLTLNLNKIIKVD